MKIIETKINKMEKETIFREGDRVYHHSEGFGEVTAITSSLISINFPSRGVLGFSIDVANKYFSFTEYKVIKEGFSQERPMPTISVPYLESRWRYLTLDRYDACIWVKNPTYCKTRGKFLGLSMPEAGFQTVNGIICIDNLENNTVYKIIDNN